MFTQEQEEILLGLMLGDGGLWKGKCKNPQLCITRTRGDKIYQL